MDAIMKTTTQGQDSATRAVRSRYNRVARIYDLEQALEEPFVVFGRLRKALWAEAPPAGSILEVGVGTGINMRHYPPGARMTAIDISDRMLAKAKARAQRDHVSVGLALVDAQHLDFADNAFDAVVATCVFCSVPDPIAGLREALRVLKPGGRVLLLEHVRSENAIVGKAMDLVNPIAVRLSGANINRRTVENVRAAGFADLQVNSHAFGLIKTIRATKAR
jgi:ubiquinone/menaquinone biosynthesis C-methylase UbiE